MRDHSIPLPLVGAIDMNLPANGSENVRHVASRNVFNTLGHRHPLVFCGAELTPALLRMAARANGQVWIGQVPRRRFVAWPWLQQVGCESKPWREVFDLAVQAMSAAERAAFADDVGFAEREWRIFLPPVEPSAKEIILTVPRLARVFQSAVANGHTIVEADVGWLEEDTFIAANVIGAAVNLRPKAIGFLGRGASVIGAATAAALGCVKLELPCKPTSSWNIVEHVEAKSALHNWPVLVHLPRRVQSSLVTHWLNWQGSLRNTVFASDLTPLLPHIEHDVEGWQIVQCDEDFDCPGYIAEYGSLILTNWLLHVGCRKVILRPFNIPLSERVLDDFARWVDGRGDANVVRGAAACWVEPPEEQVARRRRRRKLADAL